MRRIALLLVLVACRTTAKNADAAPEASAPATASVLIGARPPPLPPDWPSFDGDAHCASVRKIAGTMHLVPAWKPDAAVLDSIWKRDVLYRNPKDDDSRAEGVEIPSGFSKCQYHATTAISLNWSRTYSCTTVAAPGEEAAAARYAEVTAVWKTCFAKRGLQMTEDRKAPSLRFRKPAPEFQNTVCDVELEGDRVQLACYQAENN